MAKRINFSDIEVDENQTLDTINEGNKQMVVRKKDGSYEIVTAEEAKERKLSEIEGIILNQTAIEKGNIKNDYLMQDLLLIKKYFMSEFPDLNMREVVIDDDLNWIKFKNFPLPDFFIDGSGQKVYYQPDKEDIVLVVSEYPHDGPFGIHVKRESPNKDKIRTALGGHVFDQVIGPTNYVEKVQELSNIGWDWVCFHYFATWNFNRVDLKKGDCLASYVETLFAALSGAYLKR